MLVGVTKQRRNVGAGSTICHRTSPKRVLNAGFNKEQIRVKRGTRNILACQSGIGSVVPSKQDPNTVARSGSKSPRANSPTARTSGATRMRDVQRTGSAFMSQSVPFRNNLRATSHSPSRPSYRPASPQLRTRGTANQGGIASAFDRWGMSRRASFDAEYIKSNDTVSTGVGVFHIESKSGTSSNGSGWASEGDVFVPPSHTHAVSYNLPTRALPLEQRLNLATNSFNPVRTPTSRRKTNVVFQSSSTRSSPRNGSPPQRATGGDERQVLFALLRDSERMTQVARATFRRHDTDGDGVLSLLELERLLPKLHERIHIQPPSFVVHEDSRSLARRRMRKFDVHGDGCLRESDFVGLYRWTLWRRFEELKALSNRTEMVNGVHRELPQKFYSLREQVGSGNFGKVRLAMHRTSGFERVMKTVHLQSEETPDGNHLDKTLGEINILAHLDHPHILRVYESFHAGNDVHIVTDVCAGGDLFDIVRENAVDGKHCPEPLTIRIFTQVLQAVAHCHDRGVMHKDLKFENIMLQKRLTRDSLPEDVHIVVIDMGLSELFGEQHGRPDRSSAACGTLVTMAPEVIVHDFTCKCDVWSVGCMIFAMLNSQPRRSTNLDGAVLIDQFPFAVQASEDDPIGLHCLLQSQSHGPDMGQLAGATQNAVSAVRAMLSFDESDRPGAYACLQMPWFKHASDLSSHRLSQAQVQVLVERSRRELRTFSNALIAKAASQLPSARLSPFVEQFKAIDVTGRGHITRAEMKQTLHQLRVPRQEGERVADAMDLSKTGCINWSEFVAALLPTAEQLLFEGVGAVFSQLDLNDDGMVAVQGLAEAVLWKGCDPALSKCAAKVLRKEIDHPGCDNLNLSQIKKLVLGRETSSACASRLAMADRRKGRFATAPLSERFSLFKGSVLAKEEQW
eukprot:TRINITY_DN16458_c0_g2_i1.p1 TRINITY_DN16458_c0_g2~~TRINITY_DN16458_c0_g2_i1.p1  ORF type:complete len:909 (-),score=109.02 TRINITY_DN16458_c0_g2_i1:23-2749(-)